MKAFLLSIAKKLTYLLAIFIIIAALLVSVIRVFTPALDIHRAKFEKWASQLLQMPVKIEKTRLSWYQYQPEITFYHVTIVKQETNNPILQINSVSIFFSIPQTIWQHKVVVSGIRIAGSDVKVHEDAAGQLSIQGFPSLGGFNSEPYQNETKAMDMMSWLSTMPRLILRDIDIRYAPFTGPKQFLTLYNLSFVNSGDRHFISGKAILHQDIPTEVSLKVDWTGEKADLATLKGKAYLYVRGVVLPQWLKEDTYQGWKINNGLLSAKIWASWNNGAFQKIQSIFELFDLKATNEADNSTQQINRISGNVGWLRKGNNQIFAGNDILIDFPKHLWPLDHFYVSLNPLTVDVGYLDLDDIKSLMNTKFLPDALRKQLSDLKLSGTLQNIAYSWNGTQGSAGFEGYKVSGFFTPLFEDKLFADQLVLTTQFTKDPATEYLIFKNNSLQFKNNDLNATVTGTVTMPPKGLPSVDLSGNFAIKQVAHLKTYLPDRVFKPDLVKWLNTAFLSGQITSGHVQLTGNLGHFPFDKKEGTFLLTGEVEKVDLKFAPDWPVINNMQGTITFRGRQMQVDMDGETLGIPLSKVHAVIPYLGVEKSPILQVTSDDIQTDLTHAFAYINASPLKNSLGKLFTGTTLTGPTALRLALQIPLENSDKTVVKGTLMLNKDALNVTALNLNLENIKGQVQFTQDKTTANKISAEWLHQPLQFNLATLMQPKNQRLIRATLTYQANMQALGDWLKIPLASVMTGETPINGQLDFATSQPMKMHLASTLKGVKVTLPDGYGKSPETTNELKLDMKMATNSLDSLVLNYDDVNLSLKQIKTGWQFYMDSPDIRGIALLPADLHAIRNPNTWIKINLDRLSLHSLEDHSETGKIGTIPFASLPAINFTANNVSYNKMWFGRLNVIARPHPGGIRFPRIQITSNNLNFLAIGNWASTNKSNQTHFEGTASTHTVSRLLRSLGFKVSNLVANDGSLAFNLTWPDVPYAPAFATMMGNATLSMGKGRVINIGDQSDVKMDLGRVLSLLSLQTIPRRLSLDFSDLFMKGYSFDYVKAHFKLGDGNLETNDFRFDGPVASVGVKGDIKLAAKEYNLTLIITPHVTSSIPLAATVLLPFAPYIGLAALAVNGVLAPEVSKATTYYYSVKGPWANPTWASVKTAKG